MCEKVEKTLVSLRALRRNFFSLKRNQNFVKKYILNDVCNKYDLGYIIFPTAWGCFYHILRIQDLFEDAYFNAEYAIEAKKSFDLGIDVKIGVVFGFKNVVPFIRERINDLLED